MKILIVDDAAFMRMMLRNIFLGAGYEVVGEAANGVEGIQKYKELRPDFVTMDITMPEMNGIEATKAITAFDANAKIVMCSAMGQQAMVLDAIKSGARDFLVKPFDAKKVIETVRKYG